MKTPPNPTRQLRVLIANERMDRLALLATVVEELGHEVVERSVTVNEVAAASARVRPDVALVGLGESGEHALNMVSEIVREAYCPVIAILSSFNGPWVKEAAARGAYAYLTDDKPAELQSAIEITLGRFADARSLVAAIERRNEEAERELAANHALQRQALELHDGLVQSLAVARLSFDLGRHEDSNAALVNALELARDVVSRSLGELRKGGLTNAQLIRETTTGGVPDE